MKYGLLVALTENLGDDIQSLAAKQFLPRVDLFLDRDFLNSIDSEEKIKVLMNGWFTHRPENWPPSPAIEPLFVSFHMAPIVAEKLLTTRTIEYLKNYEPIGCRDTYTEKLLKSKGIDAYFSGCLTLTLDYGYDYFKTKKREDVLIVDLDSVAMRSLPAHVLRSAEIATNEHFVTLVRSLNMIVPSPIKTFVKTIVSSDTIDRLVYRIERSRAKKIPIELRLKKAEEQLRKLASAKLVVTSRLHAALPALAFGTPVIFVHRNLNDPRFEGLLQFLNYYTPSEFKKEVIKIDFENPPESPNQEILKELKNRLIKTVIAFLKE